MEELLKQMLKKYSHRRNDITEAYGLMICGIEDGESIENEQELFLGYMQEIEHEEKKDMTENS